jgi:ABC-type sugar transport system ATPase subunit
MSSLRLAHLSKSYGGEPAVRRVSLDIARGELLVLLGPSGCGKSTLLRCIAGLEEPSAGDIFIEERRVNDLEPRQRNVAMVFQSFALYPHMSVRDNLAFPLRMRKTEKGRVRERVEETARLLGLEALLDRKPRSLSGGQMQRVALGRALVRDPAVFLFDEPLSNLDARMRTELRTEIARLHESLGRTMVYVTHDQAEAMTLGDRIAVLNSGELQQVGTPEEIYNTPRNAFVATFLGDPPMNLLGDTGIRPHDVVVDPQGEVETTVELVEKRGHEVHLHCRVSGRPFLVVTREAPASRTLRLRLPEECIYRFPT